LLYTVHFKPYFEKLFPANFSNGREYLKFALEKCSVVRNTLYHSNPVSIRQVEQLACYTNDIIDSIKAKYMADNLQDEFNAPSFVSYSDSLGRKFYTNQMVKTSVGYILQLYSQPLRVGDRIKMAVEVDASFEQDSYSILWNKGGSIIGQGPELVIELDNTYVAQRANINVLVISKKAWHRHQHHDDRISIALKILPKLE
jgi:hypothetical protein